MLIDEIKAFECDKEKIKRVRDEIVLKGKHSAKIKKFAKDKPNNPKYTDPNNLKKTGAISADDAIVLYSIICLLKPKNIFEIGTWFGTSAGIMSMALEDIGSDGTIYTCDRKDLVVVDKKNIVYYNMQSNLVTEKLYSDGVRLDMVFVDGSFRERDILWLTRMMDKKIFVAHDCIKGEKGYRVMRELRKVFKNLTYNTIGIMGILA